MMQAAGRMGWSERDFLSATPSYFFNAYRGHIEQEKERTITQMALTRQVAYHSLLPHIEKGKSIDLKEIFLLPGEEIPEPFQVEVIDPEAIEKFNREADEILARMQAEN